MGKEVFHEMKDKAAGRYKHGLKATFDAKGAVQLTPHSNDHMGVNLTIEDAVTHAIDTRYDHYKGRDVTLVFNESGIPIKDDASPFRLVEQYHNGEFPKKAPSAFRE